jgi:hypothetical protein
MSLVCPWVQRQIPGLFALAGDVEMRHAAARVFEILDLQLAELLLPYVRNQRAVIEG